MWSSIAFVARAVARRSAFSWFCEVLPVWLLALQGAVALASKGDVDGRSREPLFSRPLGQLRGAGGKLGELLGRWKIQERHGIDDFMEALGFASWQRALVSRAGQSYVLEVESERSGEPTLKIVTQDLRGTKELKLPLSGQDVPANDGDGGARVCRSALVESGSRPSFVVTERFPNEREPYSICRRSLQPDGRMCIDVKKRTAGGKSVAMRAIASRQT